MADFLLLTSGKYCCRAGIGPPALGGVDRQEDHCCRYLLDHDPSGAIGVPSAIRLGFRGSTVWIAAGCSVDAGPATSFWLGTDDVMVVFTPEMSSQIGIPGLHEWTGQSDDEGRGTPL